MILNVENLHVKYGNVEALHGININVKEGEIVTILGANGAGKSTTLMAISGLVKVTQGTIQFEGEDIHKLPAHGIVTRGVAQVPEGRRVFGTLTVKENLNLGAYTSTDAARKKLGRLEKGCPYFLKAVTRENRARSILDQVPASDLLGQQIPRPWKSGHNFSIRFHKQVHRL